MSTTRSTTKSTPVPTTIPEIVVAALLHINETTSEWHVNALPANLTVKRNGTIIYDTSTGAPRNVTRMNSTSVGSVSLVPFIYLIMSILIILSIIPTSTGLIQSMTNIKKHKYEPILSPTSLTDRRFASRLQSLYPHTGARKTISQAEVVNTDQGTGSEDIRACGELMRRKLGLDLEVWNLRDTSFVNRGIVEDKKKKAEMAKREIGKITRGWVEAKEQWTAEEWEVVKAIDEKANGWSDERHRAFANRFNE